MSIALLLGMSHWLVKWAIFASLSIGAAVALLVHEARTNGLRHDQSRHGCPRSTIRSWRVSRQAHPSAPLSNDPKRRDECPTCRTDVDRSKPEGALV